MNPANREDIVVFDEPEPCPYLEGKTARMPICMPSSQITPKMADQRLADGYRRSGEFVYRPHCPNCVACESIRLNCFEFQFSRNQRRTISKGNRLLRMKTGPLQSDDERVALFNEHRRQRGLTGGGTDIDLAEYHSGFVQSCFDSFEISYWIDDRIVCVAICDQGKTGLSAVYTFFDPTLESASLGTYSILKQIEYCKNQKLTWLYLGYYVEGSRHMEYKSRFVPHERLINQRWVRCETQPPKKFFTE